MMTCSMGLADDGLPEYYYDVICDPYEMEQMKKEVFEVLDGIEEDNKVFPEEPSVYDFTDEEIREIADIEPLFDDQVTDFITEWHEK